jgi:hypothetical protein
MGSLSGWESVIGAGFKNVVFVSLDVACRFLQSVLLSVVRRTIENTDMMSMMRGTPGVVCHQQELDGKLQCKAHSDRRWILTAWLLNPMA